MGATVAFLSCCYRDQEFVRVGYYVSNEIPGLQPAPGEGAGEGEGEGASAEPVPPALPENVVPSEIVRNICADEPRVTKFAIKWDSSPAQEQEHTKEGPAASADDRAEAVGFSVKEEATRIETPLVGEAAS